MHYTKTVLHAVFHYITSWYDVSEGNVYVFGSRRKFEMEGTNGCTVRLREAVTCRFVRKLMLGILPNSAVVRENSTGSFDRSVCTIVSRAFCLPL